MYCPFCQAEDTKVIDSRLVADGSQIKRRRSCEICDSRFTTFESADLALPKIIKSNGYWNSGIIFARKDSIINNTHVG